MTVRASVKHPGSQKPVSGVIRFDTKAPGLKMLFTEDAAGSAKKVAGTPSSSEAPASEREKSLQMELDVYKRQVSVRKSRAVRSIRSGSLYTQTGAGLASFFSSTLYHLSLIHICGAPHGP